MTRLDGCDFSDQPLLHRMSTFCPMPVAEFVERYQGLVPQQYPLLRETYRSSRFGLNREL